MPDYFDELLHHSISNHLLFNKQALKFNLILFRRVMLFALVVIPAYPT